jgi:prepilin-type N-terminal cleavage/methylation domain-containing protein
MIQKNIPGFTLTEIMIVVAVIGMFVSIVIPNLADIRNRARDEKKIAELGQIVLALEEYKKICGTYPLANFGGFRPDYNINNTAYGGDCSVKTPIIDPKNGQPSNDVSIDRLLPKLDGSGIKTLYSTNSVTYNAIRYGNSRQINGICSGYVLGARLSSAKAAPIVRQNGASIVRDNKTSMRENRVTKMECGGSRTIESIAPRNPEFYYIESANGF